MGDPDTPRRFHSKSIYFELIKITLLLITNEVNLYIKTSQKGITMLLMNTLKCNNHNNIEG